MTFVLDTDEFVFPTPKSIRDGFNDRTPPLANTFTEIARKASFVPDSYYWMTRYVAKKQTHIAVPPNNQN